MVKIIEPQNKEFSYEKVKIHEWVEGEIVEIQERVNDNRKYKDKKTGEMKVKSADELRFVFTLTGYEFKHYSRWMTRSLYKEANLIKKYIKKL